MSCWYSLDTLRRVPTCQDFSHFSAFLHRSVLAKLATSSIGLRNNSKMIKDSIDSLAYGNGANYPESFIKLAAFIGYAEKRLSKPQQKMAFVFFCPF